MTDFDGSDGMRGGPESSTTITGCTWLNALLSPLSQGAQSASRAARPAGVAKRGDLAGVLAHKFKINKQEILLSYAFTANELILLSLGSRENFYRNLTR
ncbi:type II toxin-antitoxin system RelE/ParE family toxin [Cupriavidus basilensis]|uniref:type II toxin-antitoxin system RelE/ParE family toxin n=1 Tax=Cupriavidus basilensis TaxID=68895 RepID=UPI001F4235F7|nr:type II toxin-antitoxin system RelE/ParE family toxin [Cupriavidus basilensis]